MNNIPSILTSIKKDCGIAEDYEHFDADIIMHINSAFSILTQVGVGPSNGFSIQDKSAVWTDFIPDNATLNMYKTYIFLKIKLIFDPPLSSALLNAMERQINEFEWRLNAAADGPEAE